MIDPEKDPFYLLEKRVSDLICLSDKLSIENKALRSEQRKWTAERAALLQKNELAKSKIKTVFPVAFLESSEANFIRCASPPERVVED